MKFEYILLIVVAIFIVWTIIELINLHKFNIGFFDRGFRIYKKEISHRFSNWNYLDGIYEEKEGKYAFIPDMKTGFLITKFEFYKQHSIFARSRGIPLTIFGKIYGMENKTIIEYFVSYRLVGLIVLWYLVWIIIPILSAKWIGILVGIGGVGFTTFLLYLLFLFKQVKMLSMFDEISKILKIRK